VCEWFVKKGLLAQINERDNSGRTPLLYAVTFQRFGKTSLVAKWLLDHGADPKVRDSSGMTVFAAACEWAGPTLIRQLAGRVPQSHLEGFPNATETDLLLRHLPDPHHPMRVAYEHCNPHANEIAQMLILRCGTTRLENFHGPAGAKGRAAILHWVEGELLTRRNYWNLVLGCGVHGRRREPPALRKNQLPKLRGDVNTSARMHIAKCLGVRFSSAELARLRAVRVMLDPLCEPREDARRAHQFFNRKYREWRSKGLSSAEAMAAARRDDEAVERAVNQLLPPVSQSCGGGGSNRRRVENPGRKSVASATAALCRAYVDHDREDRGLGGPGGLWYEKGL